MRKIKIVGLAAIAAFWGMLIGGLIGTGDAWALPKSMRDYSVRKMFFPSGTGQMTLADNDVTALIIGSTGQTGLLTIDTGNSTETVVINGTTSVEAFRVAVGTATFVEAVSLTGDVTFGGGAGAITATVAGSSLVCLDNSATGFVMGSSGNPNMLQLVTTTGGEKVVIEGTTTATAFHVDLGTALFDEDATFGGGAGAITATAAGSSLVCLDNSATGFVMGSSGNPNMLQFDTQTGAEKIIVEGSTGVDAFHLDLGHALFDEAVVISGLTTTTGGLTSTAGVNTINDITPNATDIDFTAEHQVTFFAKVTGAVMTEADTQEDFFRIGPLSTYFEIFQDGNNSDCVGTWGDGVTGWVIPGANAADQGVQLTEGILLGSAHSYTGQTDTMTMRVAFLVGTRAELDVLQVGFRALGAYAVGDDEAEWTAAYDDKVTVGLYGNAGVIDQSTSVATSDTATACTHAAAADGDILALEVVVSAGGVTSVKIGTATPAGGTAAQTRTAVTAAYADLTADTACNAAAVTLTAGEYVPTVAMAKAAGGVSTTTIVDYYVGP